MGRKMCAGVSCYFTPVFVPATPLRKVFYQLCREPNQPPIWCQGSKFYCPGGGRQDLLRTAAFRTGSPASRDPQRRALPSVGHHICAPRFGFMCRTSVMLQLNSEPFLRTHRTRCTVGDRGRVGYAERYRGDTTRRWAEGGQRSDCPSGRDRTFGRTGRPELEDYADLQTANVWHLGKGIRK